MKLSHLPSVFSLALTTALAVPAMAQYAVQQTPATDFATLESTQNAANGKPGSRIVPGRAIPVPNTASPELQASIAAPYRVPTWNANPKSTTEWKEVIAKGGGRRRARAQGGARKWSSIDRGAAPPRSPYPCDCE